MKSRFSQTVFLLLAVSFTYAEEGGKVKLSVYYDSMCPYSTKFITKQLYPVMISPLGQHVDLELVPYGTALTTEDKITGAPRFTCMKGKKECYKDKVQVCVLKMYKKRVALDFIFCSSKSRKDPEADQKCSKSMYFDFAAITRCATGTRGTIYLKENGVQTNALKPELDQVPWIIFNGQYDLDKMDNALTDFKPALCAEFKEPKPKDCLVNTISHQSH